MSDKRMKRIKKLSLGERKPARVADGVKGDDDVPHGTNGK
jgi:hypothetical protein